MVYLELTRTRDVSLSRQLYEKLATSILSGELSAGTKLPSSRSFAEDLHVSRNVVLGVFEQLEAEGFIEVRKGSGSFVAKLALPTKPVPPSATPAPPIASGASSGALIAFRCGIPDLSAFPRARWLQAVRTVGFHSSVETWSYDEALGLRSLREAIAARLARVKGISCQPDQIVVTGGSAHGMGLLALLFANRPGRRAALVEDPVISFVPQLLRLHGLEVTAVPADEEGLVIDALPSRPSADLVFVSPAHQFPLGGTLPVARRLALLDYARRHELFVVEDDYDAEFRFSGLPVAPLCRLDPQRVIHLGTFSKSLAPALRLGYLVLPPELALEMAERLRSIFLAGSRFHHAVMAKFLSTGYLDRHIVRMRRRYRQKMTVLVEALRQHFGPRVQVTGNTTGLHLVARLPGLNVSEGLRARCQAHGVRFEMIEDYALSPRPVSDAMLLGFGNLTAVEIREGVRRLALALASSAL